jgi:hypothetical protein
VTGTPSGPVVPVRLRGCPGEESRASVTEARRAVSADAASGGRPPPTRYLVVDDADQLDRHAPAYERILVDMPEEVHLLCLVVNTGAGRGEELTLVRPALLRNPAVSTLWLGDVTGDGAGSGGWDDSDPVAAADALDVLVDILLEPAMFDWVCTRAQEFPESVAALSLRAVRYELAPDVLRDSLARTLHDLSGGDQGDHGADHPPVPEPAALTGLIPDPDGQATQLPLVLGGRLDRARETCLDTRTRAVEEWRELARVRTLLRGGRSDLGDRVRDAGRALETYRSVTVEALTDEELTLGLPEHRDQALARHGIVLDTATVPREVHEDLWRYAAKLLSAGWSLQRVGAQLRWLSHRLTPGSGSRRVGELAESWPEAGLAGASEPPAFDLGATRWPRLAGTVLAGLLGALWPGIGFGTGLLVVALAALGTRRSYLGRPDRHVPAEDSAWLPQVVAGLLGVLAGGVLGLAYVPTWAGPVGLVAGFALAGSVTWWQWRCSVRDWSVAVGLPALDTAAGELDRILATAAAYDWWRADVRLGVADRLNMLAGLFATAATVAEEADPGGPPRPGRWKSPGLTAVHRDPVWLQRQRSQGGPGLAPALRVRLIRLFTGRLEEVWRSAGRDTGTVPDFTRVRRDLTADLLAAVDGPVLGRLRQQDEADGQVFGAAPAEVVAALSAGGSGAPLVTLLDREQRLLVDRDPGRFHRGRFGPAALRQEYRRGGRTPDEADDWVETGRYVGVLGVQPFAGGSVTTVRARVASSDGER